MLSCLRCRKIGINSLFLVVMRVRVIFTIFLVLTFLQSCSERAPYCESQEGIQSDYANYSDVPSDYTGIVFICGEGGRVRQTLEFKNGVQNGWVRTYNKNILWQVGEFYNDYHSGSCTYYYKNGNIRESQYWIYNSTDPLRPILRSQKCFDEDGNEISCK